jgi:hypothetical protein
MRLAGEDLCEKGGVGALHSASAVRIARLSDDEKRLCAGPARRGAVKGRVKDRVICAICVWLRHLPSPRIAR